MQTAVEDSLIVLNAIPEAYFRIDANLRITYLNQAAENFLGRSGGEVLGTSLPDTFPERAAASLRSRLKPEFICSDRTGFSLFDEVRRRTYAVSAIPDQGGCMV